MFQPLARVLLALVVLCPALAGSVQAADPLAPETRLVAASGAPAATVKEFDIATAQDLTFTFTDFQTPAALASASFVVTQGNAIVGTASLAPPATNAKIDVTAASGHYTVRVIASPDAAFSVGTFSVCVAPKTDAAACIPSASFAGNVSAQGSAADPTVSTLSLNFDVTTAGSYTVTFGDLQFPAPLSVAPNLALFQGSTPVGLNIASGTAFTLNPGKYTLLAVAQAEATQKAGLFGITILGPTADLPVDDSFAVGTLAPFVSTRNPATQLVTLTVSDYNFPTALATAAAVVTSGGSLTGTATAAGGAVSFLAPASTADRGLKVWTIASPGAGAGSYGLSLTGPSGSLLQSAFGVNSATEQVYAFTTPALTAGSFQAVTKDFEFPSILSKLTFAVAQNGTVLNQASAAGTLDFTAAAGPAVILVAAQPPVSGNGLFNVTVNAAGAPSDLLLDKTQGVSVAGLFDSQDIVLGASGGYDVTLADLGFPTQFQDLALVVSRGGAILGKIFGGGTFAIDATPGTYQLTFIASPSAQQQYGLYGIKVVTSAPTVTLSASPATLVADESTTLSWTTADADSCTASGGNWSGAKSIGTGTEVVKVSATTTFTLSCTGPGGNTAKTFTVTATPKPAASGGGGGSAGLTLLLGLAALLALRMTVRRRESM